MGKKKNRREGKWEKGITHINAVSNEFLHIRSSWIFVIDINNSVFVTWTLLLET